MDQRSRDGLAEQIAGVAVLDEPVRRALFDHVTAQESPVSREEAASALDLPVHSAKFHLDRLVEEGLLEVEYRRLTGRAGPGAGRPAKLYRRSSRQLAVTLPERHYGLAAELLAEGLERAAATGTQPAEAVCQVAHERGRAVAGEASSEADAPRATDERSLVEAVGALLERHGYAPRPCGGDGLRLANCPFDRLAREHTGLVCGMNHALLSGVLEGLGSTNLHAELRPEPGSCCVRISVSEGARPRRPG